ncbi:MAG: hypothetical protein Kow00105_04040 [Phycisphaeraceae bacterium]
MLVYPMTYQSENNKVWGLMQRVSACTKRWHLVFVVSLLSGLVVILLTLLAYRAEAINNRNVFERRVEDFASAIKANLKYYEVALEMGRGLLTASEYVSRDEWRAFVETGHLFEHSPGTHGFAYVERVPRDQLDTFIQRVRKREHPNFRVFDTTIYEPAEYDDYAVIKFVEPEDRNVGAIGLNVASIPASSETMWNSVRLNRMAISRQLYLQQSGEGKPGIVMYLPIYQYPNPKNSVHNRWEAVTGWVALSVLISDFMNDQWAQPWQDMEAVLCELREDGRECSLYLSPGLEGDADRVLKAPEEARYRVGIEYGGRVWGLHVLNPNWPAPIWTHPVIMTFLCSSVMATLLVLLFWSLARTRNRAYTLARHLTESLRQSRERYELAIHGSREGIWDWDLVSNRIYFAPRWKELLGLKEHEVGDRPEVWYQRIAPNDLPRFRAALADHIEGRTDRFDIELEMRHADGSPRWMLCRAVAKRAEDGRALRLAGSMADITALKKAQNELKVMAHQDRLTGLANRMLFSDRLGGAIQRAKSDPAYQYAVLFLDFDRFKVINDSMGHGVGDRLLVGMAERILSVVRDGDTVARFGGDEFVVLLDGIHSVGEAEQISRRLLDVIAEPFTFDTCEVITTASIGIVSSDFGYERAEDVIRDADAAMYQAKAAGKARYCLFDVNMHTQAMRRLRLEQDLRSNSLTDQLIVHYQPIVSLDSGDVSGFESLVRWKHPEFGFIPPDQFIDIAEESGAIIELGEHVLRHACQQLADWRQRYPAMSELTINVNMSKRQLMQADLVQSIINTLNDTGLPPSSLKLEITESTVMENSQSVVKIMHRIREIGVRLAMDDFGTGHSSLSCLHRFPIDQLKIDRSFIVNMQEHREFAAVMDAIVSLAHFLHLDVVAEGIENADQLAMLQAMDCKYGQGYFFARPMPAEDVINYLSSRGFGTTSAA